MNRRKFLTGMLAAASCGVHAGCCSGRRHDGLPCMTFDGGRVFRITGIGLHRSVRLRMVADTHLALKDDRDVLYSDCYRRMAQWPTPTEPFEAMLRDTLRENPDLLILLGDNISFPTLANVEYLRSRLEPFGSNCLYTAGNHDWHFEGEPGSDIGQRSKWIAARLLPLYHGENPLMFSRKVEGVRVLMIDNSVYDVLPEQLEFFRSEISKGDPVIVCMHIPLWAHGWPVETCGCPDWGASADCNWKVERRERWPDRPMESTMLFRNEVLSSPHVIGVFAGHTHRLMFASENGCSSVVVPANKAGQYVDVIIT